MTTYDNFKSGINELKDFLDWNRFMLAGLTIWVILVVLVDNSDVSFPGPPSNSTTPDGAATPVADTKGSLCTSVNPFPGVVFIIGIVLAGLTTVAEAITDDINKNDVMLTGFCRRKGKFVNAKQNIKKFQSDFRKAKSEDKERLLLNITREEEKAAIGPGTIIFRAFSNLLIFYTAVAISSFTWFPTDNTKYSCFIDFNYSAKWISLAVIGGTAAILLAIRVALFDLQPRSTGADAEDTKKSALDENEIQLLVIDALRRLDNIEIHKGADKSDSTTTSSSTFSNSKQPTEILKLETPKLSRAPQKTGQSGAGVLHDYNEYGEEKSAAPGQIKTGPNNNNNLNNSKEGTPKEKKSDDSTSAEEKSNTSSA